jgi:hypothetical protein
LPLTFVLQSGTYIKKLPVLKIVKGRNRNITAYRLKRTAYLNHPTLKSKAANHSLFSCPYLLLWRSICRIFAVMACQFSIPFSGDPSVVLSKAQSAVEGQGGTFTGNAQQGNFDVTVVGNTIRGTYAVAGQHLDIQILSKPFFVPCSTIEGFLKNQLGSA